jgi:phosphoribosylaminoimidazole-succinocarboxamide synthase
MLSHRTEPVPFECVVRGYLSGSRLGGVPPRRHAGRRAAARRAARIGAARPADLFAGYQGRDRARRKHPYDRVVQVLGPARAAWLRDTSLALYAAGRDYAETRGIIIADTKFEFGVDADGGLRLIDEVLTPDSSRFWPADQYRPGGPQPSFDKQPLRDWLTAERALGRWNGEAPPRRCPPR